MAIEEARILVVDREPEMLRLLSALLSRGGYKVIRASGAEDALRKAKAQHPNLVVADLELPKVGGVQIIEALKKGKETKGIPVIASTTDIWGARAPETDSYGCDAVVGKPYQVVQLLSEVKRLLGRGMIAEPSTVDGSFAPITSGLTRPPGDRSRLLPGRGGRTRG